MYTIQANVSHYAEDHVGNRNVGKITFVTNDVAAFVTMGENMMGLQLPDGCQACVDTFVNVGGHKFRADRHSLIGIADQLATIARELQDARRKVRAVAAE